MKTFLRACVALSSFALASALFGSEIDLEVTSGQQLSFQLAGTTGATLVVTKLGPGGGQVAVINGTPDNGGSGWATNYFWSATIYQSGVTFEANPYVYYYSWYQGTLYGLSPGTYRISAVSGNLPEYYRGQNGSTYYIFQGDYYYNEWVDYSFEAY
jgi:hypothetical protein